MSSWRTLSLPTLAILALCGATACSSSEWPSEPVTPGNDGGGPATTADSGPGTVDDSGGGNGDDAGNPGTGKPDTGVSKPGKDASMPSGGDSGGGGASCPVANLPTDWQNTAANSANNTACNACMAQYCCDSITACANDTGCKAIYDCQANCYNDADASAAQMNTCTAACVMGSTTSQGLFNSQDSCVNTTSCASTTTCGS
jgi:hypothetical protein